MRNVTSGSLRVLLIAVFLSACNGSQDSDDDVGSDAELDGKGVMDSASTPSPNVANAPMISFELDESDGDVMNPERGFYVGYNILSPNSASRVRAGGHTLAISSVHLDQFRDSAISSSFLAQLSTGFAAARAAGFKIVLRFRYNSSFSADASRSRILGHITQLRPLFEANADVIAVMQAGFIGAWGEWHGSTNGLDNTADRTTIMNAILAALPAERGVQIRRPMFKANSYPGGALTASEAYTGTARARIGHHNDCFLASASDYGTYASPVATWEAFVGDDGRYTAVGGETCAIYAPRSDCDAAVDILEAGHWSFLNLEYNVAVLDAWTAQGCRDEIDQRLGYRFVATRVAHTEAVAPGGELDLQIDLANRGFASPYNQRPVEIVLSNGDERHTVKLANLDARRWAAGTTTRLAVRLRIPASATAGRYTLSLRLPDDASSLEDDARYAIQLANDDAFDDDTGDNLMSDALTIDPAAPGPRDPAAAGFVEL